MSIIRTGCWISTTNDFQTYTELGDGSVGYQFLASGLVPETNYFAKAWAENERGITYSSVLSLTTASDIPSIQSLTHSNVSASSATITCVVSSGYYPIATYNFTLKDSSGSVVATQASMTASYTFSSLTASTTYQYECYVVNSNGNQSTTFAGGQFTTTVTAPTVTLSSFVGATNDPAHSVLTYTIASDGALTSVLCEYDTNSDFSTAQTHTIPMTTGVNLTATIPTTTTSSQYYVRITAVNAGGTTTSSIASVEALATVGITSISSITATSAVVTISVS